jgi:uncharacterized protein
VAPVLNRLPCETEHVSESDEEQRASVVRSLRESGARFALVFGSRARGDDRPESDLDVGAWWAKDPPSAFEVDVPRGVDLLVLNNAPLELAGRVAVEGVVLFDDDPAQRVRWVATTRKIYFDELPRLRRSHREFAEAMRRGR